MLHHREADQHDDQDQAAEQRRANDVVGQGSGHREAGRDHPHHQQQPGRNQQYRAVVAVERKIDHEPEAEHRDRQERQPRDAGRDRGIEQRHRYQRAEEGQPAERDVRIAHVPSVEIEIGEQEHQQGGGQNGFAGRPPDPLGVRRDLEHLAPEAEIDADIDQHRPAERGGGRKHHAAFDHEQDGQEQRQQPGDPDHDAVEQRDAVDLVLVGVGLPQIELRQLVGAQLHHVGHDAAGIERDAKDIRGRAVLPVGPVAAAGDAHDAREAEVGPQQAGTHHAIMRHHDQALELLVAGIGEREHRPIGIALARPHVHALHDAVGPRRSGDQEAIGIGAMALDRGGQIEGGGVLRHVDRLDRAGRWGAGERDHDDRQPGDGADETQTTISKCVSRSGKSRAGGRRVTAIQHYVYFAARAGPACGRHRAEAAPRTLGIENPMYAGAAHGVSTILPI